MHKSVPFAFVATVFLSGCLSTQDKATNSYFGQAKDGFGFVTNLGDASTFKYEDGNGEGFIYQAGTDSDGLAAQAGLLPGTATAAWSPSGTGQFYGSYGAVTVSGISINGDYISGYVSKETGRLTLDADFANNTITGTSDDGLLVIDGQMTGNKMSGNVTYNGVDGDLRGLAGADQAFGVFHGNNEDYIYAGGFAAERD